MEISILGCGWLGLPLAIRLQNQGHVIKGSTTSEEKLEILKRNEIQPYLIEVGKQEVKGTNTGSFWESEVLFLNIPPGRRQGDVLDRFPLQIQAVIDKIREGTIEWVIFASSTSVYSNHEGRVSEEDASPDKASSDSGRALLRCEEMLRNQSGFDTTVIRFGGLYGYDRHPVTYLSGRKNLDKADKPVNLIHQDDCVNIVDEIIRQDVREGVFNAVSDGHPPRQEFYESAARHFNLPFPVFNEGNTSQNKIVSNQQLKEILQYQFSYPDPMDHTP
ncbi:MAG: SDR family oxidoreductase [Balneolaceae bacterium]